MARYVLAIDQGTTSSRAMIIDQRLSVKAKVSFEFRQRFRHRAHLGRRARQTVEEKAGVGSIAQRKRIRRAAHANGGLPNLAHARKPFAARRVLERGSHPGDSHA